MNTKAIALLSAAFLFSVCFFAQAQEETPPVLEQGQTPVVQQQAPAVPVQQPPQAAQPAPPAPQAYSPVTFSAWGRAVITPVAFSGEYSAASAATNTYADYPSIGFSAHGISRSKNIGFDLDFNFGIDITNSNSIAIIGDNAKLWVYPFGMLLPEKFNMLKLVAGYFKEDDFRGRIGGNEFGSWTLPNGGKDEDNIFSRFNFSAGAYLKLDPLKWLDSKWNGLMFAGAFGSNSIDKTGAPGQSNIIGNGLRAILNLYNNEDNDLYSKLQGYDYYDLTKNPANDGDRKTSAKDVFRAGQYAIGYKIPEIGFARFQFIGNNRNVVRWNPYNNGSGVPGQHELRLVSGMTNRDADVIEFAFLFQPDFLPVLKGFRLDAGIKLPQEFDTTGNFQVYPGGFNGDPFPAIKSENINYVEKYTIQQPRVIAIGFSWTPSFFNALTIGGRFDTSFDGKTEREDGQVKVEYGMVSTFWITPSYRIINNLVFGVDFGIDAHNRDTVIQNGKEVDSRWTDLSEYTDIGFAPWLELGVGGGRVKTGVVIMMPGSPRYRMYNSAGLGLYTYKFKGDPVISVPVSITYSF